MTVPVPSITICLPPYLSARSRGQSISVCRAIKDAEGDVILDASAVKFVDPFGLTLLGASFHELKQYDQGVEVFGLNTGIAGYLHRMDLFQGVEFRDYNPEPTTRHDRADSLVELTMISDINQADDTASRLTRSLVGGMPGADSAETPHEMSGLTTIDQLSKPVDYALRELIENALTHGRRSGHGGARVWVAGQYYPSSDLVRLAVTDDGCGFLETLRGHPELRRESHHGAILTAMRPRISCNRDVGIFNDSSNEGVGLFVVARIAEKAGGKAVIVSGDSYHSTKWQTGVLNSNASWRGVAIALEMKRRELLGIRISELLPELKGIPRISLRFE